MMAATNGHTGAKLEFRSSVVKKNTEFYKNYVAGKLTDGNFKWPECPCKFITKNHLIGTIQSPNHLEVEYVENDRDGPHSPNSSHSAVLSPQPSTSNQLMSDMVKMVKGETNGLNEIKNEANAPKVEAPANANPVYIIQYPYGLNMTMNSAMMANIPMLGMPPQAPLQPWGNATPAQNPAATPMHPGHPNPLAIEPDQDTVHKSRNTKLIPLESNFDVDHFDPRPPPQSVPREIFSLYRTTTTSRFIETYKRTNRNVANAGAHRLAHSNPIAKDLQSELMRKKVQTQKELKSAVTAEDFHGSQLENVSDSDGDSDSDMSPTYELAASNDESVSKINGIINPESILPTLSSDNESDVSHVTAEFHPVSKKDGKEKRSRSSKKRRRSRSSEKHHSSGKHARKHSSSKHDRSRSSAKNNKQRSSDKHVRSRGSDKRDRSRSVDKQENKRKRVAPLLINKRNNTVTSKDDTSPDERMVAQSANKENKAPAYVQPLSKDEALTVEANLENLFSGPIRTGGSQFHLELFPTVLSSSVATSSRDHAEKSIATDAKELESIDMAKTFSNDVHSVIENNGSEIDHNDNNDGMDEMDEMEVLKVSQSPNEMIDETDEIIHVVKTDMSGGDSDDESGADEALMKLENIHYTVPPNTDKNSNQVNANTNTRCMLCTYQRDNVKKLVAHYVNAHPDNEVYISRMTANCCESVKKGSFIGIMGNKAIKSNCPFCDESMSMEAEDWITHFTEHTGEFEYRCSKCDLLGAAETHERCDDASAITVAEHAMDNCLLRAYMCSNCNFTQLDKSRVINHMSNEHQICVDLLCQEFVLLREMNAPLTTTNDSAVQKVNEVARELAQCNEVRNSVVVLTEDSQESAGLPNAETNTKQESIDNDIPPQESSNAEESIDEHEHVPESVETEREKEEKTHLDQKDEVKMTAVVADEKIGVPSCSTEPAPTTQTQSPDSKTTSALLAAKEQYPSERPLAERMQTAILQETIELSSDEEEPEPVMMSCYSVDTSDEE